jgi:hydroxypyruvate reductase
MKTFASEATEVTCSLKAAEAIVSCVSNLTPSDLVIVLISGGGSALLPWPRPGLSLREKTAVIRELSRCGTTINQLNIVRQRLSGLKGGGLARKIYPAQVCFFVLFILLFETDA